MNDRFNGWFAGAFLFSALAIVFSSVVPANLTARIIYLTVFGLAAAICTILAWRTLWNIRSYRMGLLGEQAVAEELQRLISAGYKIFHDVPCERGDSKWNIDHVAVGPAGVFAIETKYRTKRPAKEWPRRLVAVGKMPELSATGASPPPPQQDYKAEFDGKTIKFSSGDFDSDATEQARNNATWLETELSKAIGERVAVRPIVALPGWWVTRKANSDVTVMSGREIYFIAKEPPQYPRKFVQRVSYQLEQRCRDVEF